MSKTSITTSNENKPLSVDPTAEEIAADANSLREIVKEKRAVFSAFEDRMTQINTTAARDACSSAARMAGEIIDELVGAAIAEPRTRVYDKKGRIFTRKVTDTAHLKAILATNPHPKSTRYGTLLFTDIIFLDKQGRLFQAENSVHEHGNTAEAALLRMGGNVPIKDLETLGAITGSTNPTGLGILAGVSHELGDEVDPRTWETITARLNNAIRETVEKLRNETEALDKASRKHGLPV